MDYDDINVESKKVKVSSIYKRFRGSFLNQSKISENREIFHPGFTRLGMELNGIFLKDKILAVVYWGQQESIFLDKFEPEKQREIIVKIMEQDPPLFLLSKNFRHSELLLEINRECNGDRSAIIQVMFSTVEIYSLIGSWISKALSKWTTIHGTVLNIWGEGVLIIGDPGIGKSETASELIKMNHLFLCDDAVNITRIGNVILAKPNPFSKGFIHLRGLGILNIKEMFGSMKIIDETKISVVIELKNTTIGEDSEKFENIGDEFKYYNLLNQNVPHYILPVTSGRKISELIELAVIDMKLKKQGYNSAKEMDKRCRELISAKSK